MQRLGDLLSVLAPDHREALLWFHARRNDEVAWADLLAQGERMGRRLVTGAARIYKPEGWEYVLSIRPKLHDFHPVQAPVLRADGTWVYQYQQENLDYTRRDDQHIHQSLNVCSRNRVPVGVLWQVAPQAGARYLVLGLALRNCTRSLSVTFQANRPRSSRMQVR